MTDVTAAAPAKKAGAFLYETVTWVQHWTDSLFSFRTTRDPAFRFQSGQFVMVGLEVDGKPLLRAYSIASPSWHDELEFYSIKVESGPLTSRLQKIQPGDTVLMGKKPTGTLVLDAVKGGKRLFLFGTGTGLAPWLSVARDPDAFARFEQVYVCHGVRQVNELAYRDLFTAEIHDDPLVGEEAKAQLTYYPTVTREPFEHQGRFPDLINSGQFFRDLGFTEDHFNPAEDRVMLCGSMEFIKDMAAVMESQGMTEGSNAEPGDYVLERAFVG